jgi:lipopolysaccharide transport system ATP-binding protein
LTSSDPSIQVDRLGKRYSITGSAGTSRRSRLLRRLPREPLWALRDISFEVPRGSTLGVIGRNGAGKTTLLKILSQVTAPTEGRALLRGHASALLEVGTGFHPELTGRENVFLNGAILGMRRREIVQKFDEIVAFSEIEKFIDTPVKRYSSGMNLRLAFAVAAHLEPDILLVDEVLAVGDASFQAKCLGKMGDVTSHGRTVVLVSHSMPTIASLAERCIWLEAGAIRADGPPAEVIRSYLEGSLAAGGHGEADLTGIARHPGDPQEVRFTAIRLLDADGRPRRLFYEREPIVIEVDLDASIAARMFEIRAYVKTEEGMWLFSVMSGKRDVDVQPGRIRLTTRVDPNYLAPGRYRIDLALSTLRPQDAVHDAIRFEVEHSLEGYDDPALRGHMGYLRFPELDWSYPEQLSVGATGEAGRARPLA